MTGLDLAAEARWWSPRLHSTERCALYHSGEGWELRGEVDLPVEGVRTRLTYRITADPGWRTCSVLVAAGRGPLAGTPIRLTAQDGDWLLDGRPQDDLHGCADVDLGFSPSTNTLPIRRLAPPVGAAVTVDAAWLTFPALTVQRLEQHYERVGDRRWRYRSGAFSADLDVDEHGLVRRYGQDLWLPVSETAPGPAGGPGSALG